ncbi:MAG TPA: glycosyltransferase family 4 protein [Microlunatus sp.]
MKLLYVTEGIPNRDPVSGDGSSMIPYELLRVLPSDVQVTLLTFAGPAPVPDVVRRRCEQVVVLPTRSPVWSLIRSVPGRHQAGAQQRHTPTAAREVARRSAAADVTLIHGPHVLALARHVRGPVVLQTVDPWSIRLGMDRDLARGWRGRYRSVKRWQALSLERRLPPRARLLTVGARDAGLWSALLGREVRSVPNGVEEAARPARRPGPPVVCFTGSLNYEPNVVSARALVEEIAPQLWRRLPTTRFLVAGRQPTAEVLALAGERVEVLPNVASMLEVFHRADVAVFPDRHGVGIRNSVREAVAAGLPVVATSAAAREQQDHPLLQVEHTTEGLVARVLEVLEAAQQGCRHEPAGAAAVGRSRSWADAAAEYVAELRAAAVEEDTVSVGSAS